MPPLPQKSPQLGSQLFESVGTQDPSLSQDPAHSKLSQSGQQTDASAEERVQQRDPAAHSAWEPPAEHSPVARVMQIPMTQIPGFAPWLAQSLSQLQSAPGATIPGCTGTEPASLMPGGGGGGVIIPESSVPGGDTVASLPEPAGVRAGAQAVARSRERVRRIRI